MARNAVRLGLAALAFTAFFDVVACNYTDGPCYRREDIQNPSPNGVGGGPIVPGTGGFGDAPPPPRPQSTTDPQPVECEPDQTDKEDESSSCGSIASGTITEGATYGSCSGPCDAKCQAIGIGSFSPSLFKFVTTLADDGTGKAGGWQEASATLRFVRWTELIPEWWDCPVKVGMPLRTEVDGTISTQYAASISADVANAAGSQLMHGTTELPSGIFCSKLPETMTSIFKTKYSTVGARATKP